MTNESPPLVDRPEMPDGYGLDVADSFLTWDEVERRLLNAMTYWLASTRPDGRPHVIPRWGIWLDGRFWYDGSPETRHAQNVESNPSCALHLEDGMAATIIEGTSHRSSPISEDLGRRISEEYKRKYSGQGYSPEADAWSDAIAGGMRVVTPKLALAWSKFPDDVTRFVFARDET
ncbi:MAG: pyridoxamine 5'-phosphate oxidase family protein [Acidimicrobiia bacterium]